MSAKNVKKKKIHTLYVYTGKITEYFVGWLYGFQEGGEISQTSFCDMLHLQYGPLVSWLHQCRQTNNTYKREICRCYNSIPVGVIVTGFKTKLGRFRKETMLLYLWQQQAGCNDPRGPIFHSKKENESTEVLQKKRAEPQKRTTAERSRLHISQHTCSYVASVAGLLKLTEGNAWSSRARAVTAT